MRIDSFEALIIHEDNFKIYTGGAILDDNKLILEEGNYNVRLEIETDKDNNGDLLGVYLDDEVYDYINLPVGLEERIDITLTLDIKQKRELSFINESDDFLTLKFIDGGLYMSEPLQIISLSKFNPFSFDLELNIPFTNDISVKVQKVGTSITDLTEIQIQVVDKLNLANPAQSTEQNPKLKTVIVSGTTPVLFEPNTQYKVEVYNSGSLTSGLYSFDFNSFPMMNQNNCTVKVLGTRLLAIEFDYPVKNLKALSLTDPTNEDELNNFYIGYYGDNISVTPNAPEWLGDIYLTKNKGTATETHPFSAIISPDNRRMVLQRNISDFNTGTQNSLIVNYTLTTTRNLTVPLMDYSGRIIANFEKPFTCTRNQVATEVDTVTALSNHEVQVEFEDNVCVETEGTAAKYFNLSLVLDPLNKTSLTVDDVQWVGNGFSKLLYTLDDTSATNLLPIPTATVEVGTVLDASGLDTPSYQATIPVPPTQPKFINAYQETPGMNPTDTKIRIVYNEKMTIGTGNNSAQNPLNYMLQDPDGNVITIPANSITVVSGQNNMQFTLTIPSVLSTGMYTLTAYDPIEDFTGVNIQTTPRTFEVIDYVAPKITKVIATVPDSTSGKLGNTDNAMIIMFDKQMDVTSNGVNSVLTPVNYVMEYWDSTLTTPAYVNYVFNTPVGGVITDIDDVYDDRWIRYTFPVNSMSDFIIGTGTNPNIIHAGYVQGQNVYYVRSKSGNIYPLCTTVKIDEFVNKLNISATGNTTTVSNDNQIVITLNSGVTSYANNLFGTIDMSDFVASNDGGTTYNINPISAVVGGYPFNKLTLTFPADSFKSGQTISLRVVTSPKSTDIFNKLIVGNVTVGVTNNIPTALTSIGLLNVNHSAKTALVELLFEKSVSNYAVTDFDSAYINGGVTLPLFETATGTPVPSIGGSRPNSVQITTELPSISDTVLNNLYMSTSTSTIIPIVITDVNGKPISPFTNEHVDILKANSVSWKYNPATGSGSTAVDENYVLTLNFSSPITTQYVGTVGTVATAVSGGNTVVTVSFTGARLGKFNLTFNTAITGGATNINGWTATMILDTAKTTLTIKLAPSTAGQTLFATAAAINPATARQSFVYVPYGESGGTPNTDNSAIVSQDNVQLFRIIPNGTIV